jgi:hypothetical protein
VINHLKKGFDVLPLFERTMTKGLFSLLCDFLNDLLVPSHRLACLHVTRLFQFVQSWINIASGRSKSPLATFLDEIR